jgi:transposase
VDVSSKALDVQVRPGGAEQRFAATPEGLDALVAFCRLHQVELAVMEATGGYEKLAYGLLWERGIQAAVVNPRAVRRFAQAMGMPEKTDRIDAGMIAWFAATKEIVAQEPPPEAQERLRALVTRLRQLTDLRSAQSNQRRLVSEARVIALFEELVAVLKRQTRELEEEIADLIAADPLWKALSTSFREIKGVAGRTVSCVMAQLPEIGLLNNKAITKLTGYAPLADDSGQRNGKRSIRGGRTQIRSILFVVAEVVRRHDPDFKAFHQRLTAKGKPKKVIRVALARKLLVRLNAKARDVRKNLALADLAA